MLRQYRKLGDWDKGREAARRALRGIDRDKDEHTMANIMYETSELYLQTGNMAKPEKWRAVLRFDTLNVVKSDVLVEHYLWQQEPPKSYIDMTMLSPILKSCGNLSGNWSI